MFFSPSFATNSTAEEVFIFSWLNVAFTIFTFLHEKVKIVPFVFFH